MSAKVWTVDDLPGLDCGLCGYRKCEDLAAKLAQTPELLKRCIHLADEHRPTQAQTVAAPTRAARETCASAACATDACATCTVEKSVQFEHDGRTPWRDTLDREFDFYLEHFPEDPGPREIIIPHNPMLTREMDIRVGDILIGRPLGMSCGCPITHCGVAMSVDERTGVIVWCVTGPLGPRAEGFKDLGYYIAEGYEGIVHEARTDLQIGRRYYFQPRMCMLQWRHSGLINYLNRAPEGWQVRLEGLWIG